MLFVEEIARLERDLSGQFRQLSSIEAQIHDRLASQADGKTLKGNELSDGLAKFTARFCLVANWSAIKKNMTSYAHTDVRFL